MTTLDPTAEALWATRRRWAIVVAATGAFVQLVAAFAPGVGAWDLVNRSAVFALCVAAAWVLARSGPGGAAIFASGAAGRALLRTTFFALAAQQVALLRPHENHLVPPPIWGIPVIALLAALLDGWVLGAVLSLVPLGALCFWLAVLPPAPILLRNTLNASLACAALGLFAAALVARLRAGAGEQAASVAALRRASGDVRALQQALSERIATALAAVEASVALGAPDAEGLVNTLSDELRNARDSAGPGGSLPPSELPVRLEQLRVQLGVVVLAVTGAGLTPVALFLFWRGPQENLRLCLACLALTAAFGVARAVVPAAGNHLTAAYLLLVFSLGLYAAVAWFGRTPELPPTIHGLVLWAVLATGAVGLRLGLLFTAAGATGLAVGIHQNPGLPPLLPLNFALGLGAACVVVDRLPKELLQQLRRWQEQAAAEIHLHRRLAATLFHDLANPLLVIQLLLTEARTPEDEQRLRAMVRRMRLVLDTALGGPDAPEALDASVLCGELEQLFREKLQRKRLRLRVDGAAGVRLWASAPILRESVLGNLLSNAIKFSAPGAEIELRVAREGGAAVIAVEDRGPGVPSEVRAAVQGRREAPSRPGSEGEPGSGFGLMLAVDYLTAMSGTLEVTDRPGGGTSVRVRLPVASASTR